MISNRLPVDRIYSFVSNRQLLLTRCFHRSSQTRVHQTDRQTTPVFASYQIFKLISLHSQTLADQTKPVNHLPCKEMASDQSCLQQFSNKVLHQCSNKVLLAPVFKKSVTPVLHQCCTSVFK